ncbi:MAG: hypothetical protein QHH02_02800 [Syntrophomonadaceae bacterium]|nr:hypothetical protein [Syntrophomonadaceae bacterium]
MFDTVELNPGERTVFKSPKAARYYLVAGTTVTIAGVGLIYFMMTWSLRFPSFLLNTGTNFLMNLSGIILSVVFAVAVFIFYRESRGSIVLTDQRLILSSGKTSSSTAIPLGEIEQFILGSSPLEKLSGCQSLWIKLSGEPNSGYLAGPLLKSQANDLYLKINRELTETKNKIHPLPAP